MLTKPRLKNGSGLNTICIWKKFKERASVGAFNHEQQLLLIDYKIKVFFSSFINYDPKRDTKHSKLCFSTQSKYSFSQIVDYIKPF